MYFFGLSKEEVLSQKHDVPYKETFNQNPVTLFGRQVYPVNSNSSNSVDGSMKMKDIDLRLPADHYAYVETGFHSASEANKEREALDTNWSGKRDPRIVIDLEELPTTEDEDSVSYVPETEPSCLAGQISSNSLKVVGQSRVEDGSAGLLDLNTTPDELVSEPHLCFLQDLNCPYVEETETSCEKSGVDDGPTSHSSPKCQNVHEKDGTESPASDTSCCTTENNLRRGSLDPSCRTRLEFPELPENECCNEGVEEEEEFSEVMLMAAESLVHISAVSYQNKDKPKKGNVEPRCFSCDSYELHTLGISGTSWLSHIIVLNRVESSPTGFLNPNALASISTVFSPTFSRHRVNSPSELSFKPLTRPTRLYSLHLSKTTAFQRRLRSQVASSLETLFPSPPHLAL